MPDSPTQTTAQLTRRVRILVMIDPAGHWEANGSASYSDKQTREQLDELCGDMGPPPWGYHWIEADVPVPVQRHDVAVEGVVINAE